MQDFTASPPPTATIAVQRPPLWSTGLTLVGTIAGACTLTGLAEVVPRLWQGKNVTQEALEAMGLAGFWVVLLALGVGKRLLTRLRKLPPITFDDDGVLLPRGPEALGSFHLKYTEIMAVNEGGRPPRRQFFVESDKSVFHLPQEMFVELDGPERFFLELRRRIMALPQGGSLLEQTEQKRRAAVLAMNVQPFATQALLGVIAVLFLNTWLKGALDAPFGLLRWGANAAALVHQGDYYRLFAANFLHGGWIHVVMNGLALYYLGTLLERLLGWARFLIIYLTSGFVAMLASTLTASALMSVGASGCIFGLLGGFAVVSWRLRAQLPLGLRQTPRWWVSIVTINVLLPMLWPIVDLSAHIGGFVTGTLVTALFVSMRKTLPPPAKPITLALAGALVVAYLAGLGMAVVHAAHTDPAAETAFAELLLRDKSTDPTMLNTLAWLWAFDANSTQPQLLAAEASANEAVHRDPDVSEYQDTAALVAFRLGNLSRAIAAEERALALDHEKPFYADQMVRFLTSDKRSPQDALFPNGMALNRKGESFQLDAKRNVPEAGTLFVVLMKGEHPAALIRVVMGKNVAPPMAMPEEIPHDKELTVRPGAWIPDPNIALAGEVHWHAWKLPETDD